MKGKTRLMKTVAQAIQPAEATARTKLQHRLDAARASLHNGGKRVRTTARHAVDTTDGYVHSKPWPAIGIAAAAGAAIAAIIGARMQR